MAVKAGVELDGWHGEWLLSKDRILSTMCVCVSECVCVCVRMSERERERERERKRERERALFFLTSPPSAPPLIVSAVEST